MSPPELLRLAEAALADCPLTYSKGRVALRPGLIESDVADWLRRIYDLKETIKHGPPPQLAEPQPAYMRLTDQELAWIAITLPRDEIGNRLVQTIINNRNLLDDLIGDGT